MLWTNVCQILRNFVNFDQGILKGESGLSFWPLFYVAVAILMFMYGGDLLYLWIWRN